jgi:hypothetical protein
VAFFFFLGDHGFIFKSTTGRKNKMGMFMQVGRASLFFCAKKK